MRLHRFKTILPLVCFFVCSIVTNAQTSYQTRLQKTEHFWERLKPKYTKLQYAGGIALISAGLGWNYGSRSQWETDALMGFIPAYSTQNAKMTLTLKQSFLPWNNRKINNKFTFDPLTCGLAANSVLGNEFWVREPDKYPSNYYSFSTKIRFWVHLGQRITLRTPEEKRFWSKSVTLFYELSSCDLYIANAIGNRYLKPSDFLRLSLGIKFQIF